VSEDEADKWREYNRDLGYSDRMSKYHRDLEWRDREKRRATSLSPPWQFYAAIGGMWAVILSAIGIGWLTGNSILAVAAFVGGVFGFYYTVNRLTKKHW
jgi:Flp pilus assembly protein TadB